MAPPACAARASRLLVWVLVLAMPSVASSQFLRIGPFNFTAKAKLEGVYTTNVEQERPSEATADREDYYLITGLDLASRAEMSPNTALDIETGVSVERHFKRPDLDNSTDPFGKLRLSALTELGHYIFNAFGSVERTSESAENTYDPEGRKKRDVQDQYEYGMGANWKRGGVTLEGSYDFTSERHAQAEFQDADQDEQTLNFLAGWRITKSVGVSYTMERTKTDVINSPDSGAGWLTTETISLDWLLPILKRPSLTYSLGVEKEDTDEEKGSWDPTHTLTLSDAWELSPVLRLGVGASYTYEQNPEANDVALTGLISLEHEIGQTAMQKLTLTKEPVRTLGSTADTDNTTVHYNFTKRDLFIYNLMWTLDIEYMLDKPMDSAAESETTWTYGTGLTHTRALSRKIDRRLAYRYDREDSSLEKEILEEHRVTLSYVYTF